MAAVAELNPVMDGELIELPLNSLIPASDNPRKDLGDLAELAASITANGLLEPIVATPADKGRYLIVAGHRRLAAAKVAALETVPVYIRVMDDQQRVAAMLVENLQRTDLAPLEEAGAFRRLIEDHKMGQRQLAEQIGRSQGHISKRLVLLELPANVLKAIDSGGITIGDALELAKLKDMPKRLASAFAKGTQWRGQYARAVEDELDEHKLAEAIGKATQELKQSGLKVVEFKTSRNSYYPSLPAGAIALDGYEARQLKLTPANHKNEACHAAAVNPRNGDTVYVCTKPASHKGKKLETPADEKEKARKGREAEKRAQLRAREKNIELGALLEKKLAAPKVDARNLRLLVDMLLLHDGTEIANRGLRYTDEASQTVITKKDGSVSRIAHVEGLDGRRILERKLDAAKTPEEIMGVILQALVAASTADTKAVPPSQRFGHVRGLASGYANGDQHITKPLAAIAKTAGVYAGAR